MPCWTCRGEHPSAECPHRVRRRVSAPVNRGTHTVELSRTRDPNERRSSGHTDWRTESSTAASWLESRGTEERPGVLCGELAGTDTRAVRTRRVGLTGAGGMVERGAGTRAPLRNQRQNQQQVGAGRGSMVSLSEEERLRAFGHLVGQRINGVKIVSAATWQALNELARVKSASQGLALLGCALAVWAYDNALLISLWGIVVGTGTLLWRHASPDGGTMHLRVGFWTGGIVAGGGRGGALRSGSAGEGAEEEPNISETAASLERTRRVLLALACLPSALDAFAQYSFLCLAGRADCSWWRVAGLSFASMVYAITMFGSVFVHGIGALSVSRAKFRILKLTWYAVLIIEAILFLDDWRWEIIRRGVCAALLSGAADKVWSVTAPQVERSVHLGVVVTLQQVLRAIRWELSADSVLKLVLARWVVDFWSQPSNLEWLELRLMLKQAVVALGAEVVDTRLAPTVSNMVAWLDGAEVDSEAKLALAQAEALVDVMPPSFASARLVLLFRACPSVWAALLVLLLSWPHYVGLLLPLIGPIMVDALRLRTLSAELSSQKACAGAASPSPLRDDGLLILLTCLNLPLARVWNNARWAVRRLGDGIAGVNVHQETSGMKLRLVYQARTLAKVAQGIQKEGVTYEASWILKDTLSVTRLHQGRAQDTTLHGYGGSTFSSQRVLPGTVAGVCQTGSNTRAGAQGWASSSKEAGDTGIDQGGGRERRGTLLSMYRDVAFVGHHLHSLSREYGVRGLVHGAGAAATGVAVATPGIILGVAGAATEMMAGSIGRVAGVVTYGAEVVATGAGHLPSLLSRGRKVGWNWGGVGGVSEPDTGIEVGAASQECGDGGRVQDRGIVQGVGGTEGFRVQRTADGLDNSSTLWGGDREQVESQGITGSMEGGGDKLTVCRWVDELEDGSGDGEGTDSSGGSGDCPLPEPGDGMSGEELDGLGGEGQEGVLPPWLETAVERGLCSRLEAERLAHFNDPVLLERQVMLLEAEGEEFLQSGGRCDGVRLQQHLCHPAKDEVTHAQEGGRGGGMEAGLIGDGDKSVHLW